MKAVVVAGAPEPGLKVASTARMAEVPRIRLTTKDACLTTDCDEDGLVFFNQRYTPDWKVYLDGKSVPLLRCNYLSMGVRVPAGRHDVRFVYAPSILGVYTHGAGFILGLCGVALILVRRSGEGK